MMPTYRVILSVIGSVEYEVEADCEEDAIEDAKDTRVGEFCTDDVEYSVEEVQLCKDALDEMVHTMRREVD